MSGSREQAFCSACLLEEGLVGNTDTSSASPPKVIGEYEILEEIARGGMGIVYKARQRSLNRIVALKTILSGHLASEAEAQRFRSEARAAAALQHPGIVAIHEVGQHEGLLFFSMDYIEGQSLADAVRDNPWVPNKAAECVRDIAQAIHCAHQQGVLHRDLKPSNVLIDNTGKPHITDFGLAKWMDSDAGDSNLTLSGQVVGSPNFMPPEQAAGKNRQLTPASDVYSLGALLYHLLSGRPPFLADSIPATLRLVSETDPISPKLLAPGVPKDLETICLKCLEKDPLRRYMSAQALADDLGRYLTHEPIRARPTGAIGKAWRWYRRHPAVAALVSIIALLLIAVTIISTTAATRLQRSNREGREKLREAYLSQARASRWSGRPGRRFDSLDAVQKASAIRSGLDLRNEAIAAMALVDVRPFKEWNVPKGVVHRFDSRYERYARAEHDGTIVVHRVSDNGVEARLEGIGPAAIELSFSPDGRFLGAEYKLDKQYVFKLFDLQDAGKVWLEVPDRWVRTFIFSPDGRRLAMAWGVWNKVKVDSTITFYDLTTKQELNSFALPHLPYGMAFSPDGSQFAVSSQDSSLVQLYSVPDGRPSRTLVHPKSVNGLFWAPSGTRLTAACADRNIYLWDLSANPPSALLLSHEDVPIGCPFSQREDISLSWGWNNLAKFWDTASGKEILRVPASGMEAFASNDRWVCLHKDLRTTAIWQFAGAEECRAYPYKAPRGGTSSVVLSPDGLWMASGHHDGLRLWDLATGRQSHYPLKGETGRLQLSPDSRMLVTRSGEQILCWPIQKVNENGLVKVQVGPPTPLSREEPGPAKPTNRTLAVAAGKVCVFDAQTLRVERRFAGNHGAYSGAISPDGRYSAHWGLNSQVVEIWDVHEGVPLTTLPTPDSPCVGFSPDGRWLITGSAVEYVFWECGTWIRRKTLPRGQTGGAHGKFAFASHSTTVALAIGPGKVGLFNSITFEPLATLESPEVNPVSGLSFSTDGTRLAVSTTAQRIHVWDLRLVRQQLKEINLDFPDQPLPTGPLAAGPLELTLLRPKQAR